jgi:two-component system response regulator HydG
MLGSGNTTVRSGREDLLSAGSRPRAVRCLTIAHSYLQPHRAGECCPIDPHAKSPTIFGCEREGTPQRAHFFQMRAGEIIDGGPLTGNNVSRDQFRAEADDKHDCLRIENTGEAILSCNLTEVPKGTIFTARPGDVLHLHHSCVLLVTLAPLPVPAPNERLLPLHAFGEPDIMGITGESWRAWDLRHLILAAVATGRHVFILGPTGTGKELVARAIHKMSHRVDAPFIAANGATFSSEITAYQLFGNRKDAPNVGSPASLGFFGQAGPGVFFLDEIGEMAPSLQAALLRALESGYTRIGESHETRTQCLVICATNRAATHIKHDVLPRLGVTLTTLSLDERREDLALIVRAMLLRRAREERIGAAFAKQYVRRDSRGWAHVPLHSSLILGLLRSPLQGNVRELDNILTESIMASEGELPLRWPATRPFPAAVPLAIPTEAAAPSVDDLLANLGREPPMPSRALVVEALDRNGGNIGKTAKYLRVTVRDLYRLREKYGLLDPEDPEKKD